MNKLVTILVFVLGSQLIATSTRAEGEEVTVTPLRGALYMLHGGGGNVVASVGGDGTLIIDDDYPQFAAAYDEALSTLGMKDAPQFVLNTHWHGDHTGSNNYWGERGSSIIAHINVLKRMASRQDMKAIGRVVEPSPGAFPRYDCNHVRAG